MSYRYRCIKSVNGKQCDTRISLKHLIAWYGRKPKCPVCKAELTYRDKSRERESKADVCGCDGYHFPHRKGSKYCNENKHNLTDADYQERYNTVPVGL